MPFHKKYVLITFLLLKTIAEVQGKSFGDLLSDKFKIFVKENADLGNQSANKYDVNNKFLAPAMADSRRQRICNKNSPAMSVISNTTKTPVIAKTKRYGNPAAKSKPIEVFKMTKDKYQETNKKETLKLMLPKGRPIPMQKIYCRQVTRNEINSQGDVIENIQHICSARTTAAVEGGKSSGISTADLTYSTTESILGNWPTSTPKGINCRRVMNSEFNELGEIVDSVTEVCDPPPSTTTTTRKPVINTTTKVTTTTPKPLVKVCRRVMDSYLNEEGKIIDSVDIYCKMEPAT